MARPIKRLHADAQVVRELQRRARAATSTVREQERASIILLRMKGVSVETVAEELGTTAKRVSTWSKRFENQGLAGLDDKPGRGRRPSISEAKVARVVGEVTCGPGPLAVRSLSGRPRARPLPPARERSREPTVSENEKRILAKIDRFSPEALMTSWSRLVEAFDRGPRLSLGQARRSELHRSNLRQPLRRRRRRDRYPHLVAWSQAERRLSSTDSKPRPERPGGAFQSSGSLVNSLACCPGQSGADPLHLVRSLAS